jgi:hypothetical protein
MCNNVRISGLPRIFGVQVLPLKKLSLIKFVAVLEVESFIRLAIQQVV